MSEEIKFTAEEMKEVNDIRQKYVSIQNQLGQVGINKIRLNQQHDDLETLENALNKDFLDTQDSERKFVESINTKYGEGNLDINTGVFTKSSTEQTEKKS